MKTKSLSFFFIYCCLLAEANAYSQRVEQILFDWAQENAFHLLSPLQNDKFRPGDLIYRRKYTVGSPIYEPSGSRRVSGTLKYICLPNSTRKNTAFSQRPLNINKSSKTLERGNLLFIRSIETVESRELFDYELDGLEETRLFFEIHSFSISNDDWRRIRNNVGPCCVRNQIGAFKQTTGVNSMQVTELLRVRPVVQFKFKRIKVARENYEKLSNHKLISGSNFITLTPEPPVEPYFYVTLKNYRSMIDFDLSEASWSHAARCKQR